ncbi:MAG: segregation ATPase FtsK/SpoIIIE, family, partial [Thermodesulfobacteriota bacterium]|nr:segregation ATPase FtsK/SpoIIIE, family [Thermodesulfobacteriota bacterium]
VLEKKAARSRDFLALIVLAMTAFLFLSLLSYDSRDPSLNSATPRHEVTNLCGLLGAYIADGLIQLLGLSSMMAPMGLLLIAMRLLRGSSQPLRWSDLAAYFLLISSASTLVERVLSPWSPSVFGIHPGGALGALIHEFLGRFLGRAGELVLLTTTIVLCPLYLKGMVIPLRRRISSGYRFLVDGLSKQVRKIFARPKSQVLSAREPAQEPFDSGNSSDTRRSKLNVGTGDNKLQPVRMEAGSHFDASLGALTSLERLSCLPKDDAWCTKPSLDKEPLPSMLHSQESTKGLWGRVKPFPWKPLHEQQPNLEKSTSLLAEGHDHATSEEVEREPSTEESHFIPGKSESQNDSGRDRVSIKVSERADAQIEKAVPEPQHDLERDDYKFPPLDLLDEPQVSGRSVDAAFLEVNARILTQKLAELGIQGEVVEIHPGPVITMYELALAPGIPLRKVLNTSDDLAMALKSGSTRVVAPIPGKDTVGIEVPNLHREIVYFREIIQSEAFAKSHEPLKVALGKGIDGEPFAASLTRMPHLLIAGATGTGKSVGLNCLICSWLMCCHPDDVKFLMVDPKKLELSYYQDIPHLIHPVVTEAEKVPKVLSWAIREMERRYDLLSLAGAKNIEGYNQQVMAGEIEPDGEENAPQKLPYIVIIVDELAELMMVAAKDIEISIARLAQMARASGIHLILATQRPSVDVITGVIKANFPARVSFQVSARPDSRTILDTIGAENLLGMGDMLFLPPGTAKMRRLHGAFVSENEIRRIADFIKAQRSPVYLQEISRHVSEDDSRASGMDLIADEKYDEAVELVTRLGHASISLIQRHMRIGYNRAARIIEMMESEGIIGPSDGTSRPREVLARSLASVSHSSGFHPASV